MATCLNIGCGMAPTAGWLNYDNSLAVRLAHWPMLSRLLAAIGVLDAGNLEFAEFCRRHGVRYANAVARIPHATGSVDVVYSSHMIEHLDRWEAELFLAECRRVLRPGGVLRILVPDIRVTLKDYLAKGNADVFLDHLQLELGKPRGLRGWIRYLLTGGGRNHRWLFDGPSIRKLIEGNGFADVRLVEPGETRIAEPGALDLHERAHESAIVEAARPAA